MGQSAASNVAVEAQAQGLDNVCSIRGDRPPTPPPQTCPQTLSSTLAHHGRFVADEARAQGLYHVCGIRGDCATGQQRAVPREFAAFDEEDRLVDDGNGAALCGRGVACSGCGQVWGEVWGVHTEEEDRLVDDGNGVDLCGRGVACGRCGVTNIFSWLRPHHLLSNFLAYVLTSNSLTGLAHALTIKFAFLDEHADA